MTTEPDFGQLNFSTDISHGDISFSTNGYDKIITIKENGDIFVKGNLVTNDMDIVKGFKELFSYNSFNEVQAWKDTAAQMSRNADYYRGLVVQIGKLLGKEAYISDDGSVQEDILCAKVPELVAAKLR